MKIASLLFLLCALSASQPSDEVRQGHVRLLYMEEADQFSVAVLAPRGIDADRAIVEIGYRTRLPGAGTGLKQELFLVKVSAIELVPEVWVAADAVPVAKKQVARVDVTLVKDVERQRFLITGTK